MGKSENSLVGGEGHIDGLGEFEEKVEEEKKKGPVKPGENPRDLFWD